MWDVTTWEMRQWWESLFPWWVGPVVVIGLWCAWMGIAALLDWRDRRKGKAAS